MALLLDEAHWQWRDRWWCHLVSDHSLDELHAFAAWIGVPRRAFQGDHYDIPEDARPVAIEEGALVVTSREIVLALYAAGLRQRPAERTASRELAAEYQLARSREFRCVPGASSSASA